MTWLQNVVFLADLTPAMMLLWNHYLNMWIVTKVEVPKMNIFYILTKIIYGRLEYLLFILLNNHFTNIM